MLHVIIDSYPFCINLRALGQLPKAKQQPKKMKSANQFISMYWCTWLDRWEQGSSNLATLRQVNFNSWNSSASMAGSSILELKATSLKIANFGDPWVRGCLLKLFHRGFMLIHVVTSYGQSPLLWVILHSDFDQRPSVDCSCIRKEGPVLVLKNYFSRTRGVWNWIVSSKHQCYSNLLTSLQHND